MRIRLGANPIIWSNDDMQELGAETSLETCLAQARDIGFEGMELGHKFPRDARELAAILARFGLACVSGWYSAQLLARDARAELTCLRPHLDLLKGVGSSVLGSVPLFSNMIMSEYASSTNLPRTSALAMILVLVMVLMLAGGAALAERGKVDAG